MSNVPPLPIAVIGAGSWGTALALLLARNGNRVHLWGNDPIRQKMMQEQRCNSQYLPGHHFPDSLQVYVELADCVRDVRDILLVVPSPVFRDVLLRLKPCVRNDVRLCWGTKGVDPNTKQLLHEVVADIFGRKTPMAVLAGPSFAKEVADNQPTAISLAGNDEAFIQNCVERFHNDRFRVYINNDLVGIQLCGALKNILAIAVGIADGLRLGANTRAALITRGLAEMGRLNQALGGDPQTLMSLAGVGDVVLTCTDDQSRNRRLGMAIGSGIDCVTAKNTIGQEVEGLSNAKQIYELAKAHHVEMPIVEQVYRILHCGQTPKQVISELLDRSPKRE